MRKITLELDSLAVESFDTTSPARGAGTVVAYHSEACTQTCDASCFNSACTCPGVNTCDVQSCLGTCFFQNTCRNSCANCGTDPFSCIYTYCTSCC